MSKQTNKNQLNITDLAPSFDGIQENIEKVAQSAGIVLMTAAATAGLVEIPGHHEKKAILATAPDYGFNNQTGEEQNPLRREKEEAGPHYISYGTAQRTPGRAGRM